MKTKFLLIIGTVFAIAVGWNVAIYYRAYRAARTYQGQTMDQWLKKLATDPTAGTNVLKLRQVITGEEPDVITFEVPISYDLLEYGLKPYGIGKMNLLMDNEYVSHFTRATNGNCLFIWDTIYDRARLHHLQVELT
jgi:hypothetical protein